MSTENKKPLLLLLDESTIIRNLYSQIDSLQNENIKMREALRRILLATEVGSDEGSALALINTEAREALGECK